MKKTRLKAPVIVAAIIGTAVVGIILYVLFFIVMPGNKRGQDNSSNISVSDSGKINRPGGNKKNKPTKKELETEIVNLRQKIKSGQYEEASKGAENLLRVVPGNPELLNILASTKNLVEYQGVVEHIFFHPLIAYPERAFKSPGQDMYMVTVPEFNKILDEVYKRGFILVDLAELYTVTYDDSGAVTKVTPNKIMLPEGKKPLVISIDDLNYYEYMIKDGQVFKLVLDKNGEVETYSVDGNGKEVFSKENEIVPILDEYVKKNPDFSFNGAKGTINLTGYEGVLGYRTNSIRYPNFESERQEARKVIEVLKKTGWSFASHSQGHRHFAQIGYNLTVEDTDRFQAEVEPLIGKTPIFVYPYGEQVPVTDAKFKYFQSKGFAIFCGVSKYPASEVKETYVLMNRRNIDGIAFKDNRNKELFEAKDVTDPVRPWYNEYFGSKTEASSSQIPSS